MLPIAVARAASPRCRSPPLSRAWCRGWSTSPAAEYRCPHLPASPTTLRGRRLMLTKAAFAPLRLASLRLARQQESRAYDLVMRVPLLCWSTFCAIVQMASLNRYMHDIGTALPFAASSIKLAMMLSTIGFLLVLAAAVLLRARPIGKAHGLEPRISAFIGTFLIYVIPLFPRRETSMAAEMVATVLILVGSSAAVAALLQLGGSFSMMAEARHCGRAPDKDQHGRDHLRRHGRF